MKKLFGCLFLLGFGAVMLLAVWLFPSAFLPFLGRMLVAQDAPAQAAFIVVLSGDSPARALGGWELYRQGLAPTILLTQPTRGAAELALERKGIRYPEFTEIDRKTLLELGVPEKRILLLSERADSTLSEARLTRAFFGNEPPQRILLVTSRYHSRRAKMTFQQVFGSATEILSAPTAYDDFDPDRWWQSRNGIRNLVFEYEKGLLYMGLIFWDRFRPWKTD